MNKLACIDYGHGGYDSGALGINGTQEKNINMSVGFKVANYLKSAGIDVCFTRDSDKVPWLSNLSQDLAKRMQIANNYNPDIFVSIHCNSFSANSKGFEIFTTPGQNNSDILATKIHSRVKYIFPDLIYREDISDGDVDKEANFYVIKYAKCPATLIEMLFISNPEEEKMLNNPEFQDKMAFAIAQGIGDYFGIKIEKLNNKEELIDMAIEKWMEDSGIKSLDNLANKGLINNAEDWKKKLEEPVQAWLLFTMLDRITNTTNNK